MVTLEPGDVVSTGTHHEALTAVGDGDTVRLSVEGFGPALTVSVHDPLKRTTWRWLKPLSSKLLLTTYAKKC